ncbi:unnamed protein product [Anisakis simplex]|uniref:Uncharacterized protein n=1 Tax=Anisakis simplex TaxID=6269 RepID=A0A0M3JC05_ANISI|nr:unnamed protein product [Anisakis simplex]
MTANGTDGQSTMTAQGGGVGSSSALTSANMQVNGDRSNQDFHSASDFSFPLMVEAKSLHFLNIYTLEIAIIETIIVSLT